MKIYFYDGRLDEAPAPQESGFCVRVDAADGPRSNRGVLDTLNVMIHRREVVLTNSLVALTNEYAWNEDEECTEIYIWTSPLGQYVRVDDLTEKEIRYAHNVEKIYRNGGFEYEEPPMDRVERAIGEIEMLEELMR